ncbi:HAD family hydrolase [Azospirillum sp. TSO22-1]|uniref:HAD family hydrolase n=1 Tax=Azospirillum sp. TSO22-1 TaxID=716789 RepID=UPI000D61E87B|nr:HAD family hydrolase [Azospirillum sp. TSO22-1]PWC54504.1 HAD family hydrolase [Azospirillum sp. TSO22-1]
MLKAVIFDVDGTLVDTVDNHARAWQEAFAHFGIPTTYQDVRSQIGKGADQLMPVFVPKEELERRGAEIDAFRSALYKRRYLHEARGFHRTRALVQRILADGKRVALASSAKGDELAVYKRAAGIDDLVDTETAKEDADKSKPHPDIFQAALAKLGIRPEEAVVVGDTPWDAKAAAKAGIPMVGVLCGGFAEADLRAAGCREVWDDPEDLLAHYGESLLSKG